jgi:UDP-N-acetylglucosamine 2-epimerase (non-hydrolysing)
MGENMSKIAVICGTRPEVIRLSVILKKLEKHFKVILIHTGQNYDENLNDIFFKELEVRTPDYSLGIHTSNFGEQVGAILTGVEKIFLKETPDKVLILGDTNSALAAIIAEKMKIPVFHMEAGNRCFNRNVPEEINRKLVDSISSYNLPYSSQSKENLLNDGISKDTIFVTGNPIFEVLEYYRTKIDASTILSELGLFPQTYFLATFHRAENVDDRVTLTNIIRGLELTARIQEKPVICSIHPRTKNKIETFGIKYDDKALMFHQPLGFFDFVKLEKHALIVLSDSGTVSEDACILGIPNIILRDATERVEVVECGASILCGTNQHEINQAVSFMLDHTTTWTVPEEYLFNDVSNRVCAILQSKYKWRDK